MSRCGQIWESSTQGIYLALGEELYPEGSRFTVLRLVSLEKGTVEFLPEYVLRAYETLPSDPDAMWRRIA